MTACAQAPAEVSRWEGLEEQRPFDVAESAPSYLLSGRNGSQMRLSASAHQLLQLRSSGISSEEIAEALSRSYGKTISGEEVEAKYQQLLERIERIEAESRDNPLGFWVRIRLVPEAVVVKIASFLAPAFRPPVAAFLLMALAVSFVVLGGGSRMSISSAESFWIGYALLMLSIVFHELGHASACAYYGARPSDIGFTLYLIYPALYSDVSSAWQLRRRQRVVVDLGGLYFQWLVAGVFLVAHAYTGWEPLSAALLMIVGNSVFSLNPVFKFDGYWMVADSLGITNLSRQPFRIVKHYVRRLRGRATEDLPWSGVLTAFLVLYSVLSFTVWGFFLWMIGPRVWRAVSPFPSQVMAYLAGSPEVGLSELLMGAFVAVLMVYIAWRMVRSLLFRPLAAGLGPRITAWRNARSEARTARRQEAT